MKRLSPAEYEEKQLEDFSNYVFGMSYQTLKDVMKLTTFGCIFMLVNASL